MMRPALSRYAVASLLGLAVGHTACTGGAPTPDEATTAPAALVHDDLAPQTADDDLAPQTVDGVPATDEAANARLAEDLDRLGVWLRARHTEDLPGADALATLHDAESALVAFEQGADRMMLRTRALAAMQFAPGPISRARLVEIAGAPDEHPAARAAAVDGLAGVPGPDPDVDALVAAAADDEDERVRAAAARTSAARADITAR